MTTVVIRRLVGEAAVMLAVTAGPYALSALPASAFSGSPTATVPRRRRGHDRRMCAGGWYCNGIEVSA
jgi:hypothetical protein